MVYSTIAAAQAVAPVLGQAANRPRLGGVRKFAAFSGVNLNGRPESYRSRMATRAEGKGPEGWEFGRFIDTVKFFNPPENIVRDIASAPFRAGASIFGRITHPHATHEAPHDSPVDVAFTFSEDPQQPAVLVTGCDSPTGRAVLTQLLAAGSRVRALVHDDHASLALVDGIPDAEDLARDNGARLEFVYTAACDESCGVSHGMVDGVGSWVCVGGGGVDAGEDEALVEKLLSLLSMRLGVNPGPNLLDPDTMEGTWGALDDVVMGGASKSGIRTISNEEGERGALFTGVVTEANNGGFASIRCKNFKPALNLSAFDGLRVTLMGDGQRYKVIVRCVESWDSVCYCLSVDTPKDEWTTLDLKFSDFKPVFRANTDDTAAPLDTSHVTSLQIMLSKFEYDGDLNPNFCAGEFELPIKSIGAYSNTAAVRIVHAGVELGDEDGTIGELISDSGVSSFVMQMGTSDEYNASKVVEELDL